jgi:hypothetical protein
MRPSSAFVPEWLSDEVHAALQAIGGEHRAKKEATVLRLAEASASGQSWSAVFRRADTCTKRIWYGYGDQAGGRQAGWCDDAAIAHALHVATERARWWVRVKHGQAVQAALDLLIEGSEDAARQLVNLVRYGYVRFEFGLDGTELRTAEVKEVLTAALALLDRVSELTATK